MNKYDSYSLAHLDLYIQEMIKRDGNKGIVFWAELKDVLKLCDVKNLTAHEIDSKRGIF